MNVIWTTKYRAPGVAFETAGDLYGKYRWRTDGRVEAPGSILLAITKDRDEASAAVEAFEGGAAPSLELIRIVHLVRSTYNVMGTNVIVREDDDAVRALRHGKTLSEQPSIAAMIEALPSLV